MGVGHSARSKRLFLEVAVSWVGDVDSACGTCGDELDRGGLCDAGAFVADDVDVVATVIDKGHVPGVHVGLAVGIGAVVLGHRSLGDDDEAMSGVDVPAGGSSGLPDVGLDIEVGRPAGLLHGQPGFCAAIVLVGVRDNGFA